MAKKYNCPSCKKVNSVQPLNFNNGRSGSIYICLICNKAFNRTDIFN